MKIHASIVIILLAGIHAFGQSAFEWANVCGHPYYSETKSLLAADPEGNVLMAGNYTDTAFFGNEQIISSGNTDIFIAKHDPQGELMWLLSDGGIGYDYLNGISVGEAGIFSCISFYGETMIGGQSYSSMGSLDIIIASYGPEGNFLWSRHIGSPKTDYANAVDTDPAGNLVITGHFYDSIAFPDTTVYALASSDIFLASFGPGGDLLWVKTLGGSSTDQSYNVSCDDAGNLLLTGSFFNDIQIEDTLLSTQDPTGVFVASYATDGTFQFAWQIDGNGLLARSYASFDADGNILHAGNFTDQVNLGPYQFNAGAFNIDIYISKYDAGGNLLWADHGYSNGSDQLISLDVGPDNDLYLTGHYLDTIHFGDITLKYTLCCGSAEIFIIRYSEDGTAIWGRQISGVTALVEDMCKNAGDELFLTGMFTGELQFEDIKIYSEENFSNYLTGVDPDVTSSVGDLPGTDNFSIFPNPASKFIHIAVAERTLYSCSIADMTGREWKLGSFAGNARIDISSLPEGIYILHVQDGKDFSGTKKILIRR